MPLVPHSLDCSQTGSRGDNSEASMGLHSEEGFPWGVSARYECAARFGRAAPCRILRCASDVCRLASPCQLRPDSKILASTCADSIRTQQRRDHDGKSPVLCCVMTGTIGHICKRNDCPCIGFVREAHHVRCGREAVRVLRHTRSQSVPDVQRLVRVLQGELLPVIICSPCHLLYFTPTVPLGFAGHLQEMEWRCVSSKDVSAVSKMPPRTPLHAHRLYDVAFAGCVHRL